MYCNKCKREEGSIFTCEDDACALMPKLIKTDFFDIESLDPDERSWYYDGDGTKRKKDS